MSHKIICAIQALQKGYYVRSSPDVSAFPSKAPGGFNFSVEDKKKSECLIISDVIVTQVLGLLDRECFQVENLFH